MKKMYILGNWKSHKTTEEASSWKQQFSTLAPSVPSNVTIILCPAFHHLSLFQGVLYALGAQDLSPFEDGAYTGEVSAAMVGRMVQYALLGHSERRTHFGETDEIVSEKVRRAREAGIRPIVCVSHIDQVKALKALVPDFGEAGMLLYEPVFAIGSGTPDTPQNASRTAQTMSAILSVPILYGGSVTPDNVKAFVGEEYLAGVGVGGASLDPVKFSQLIKAVI